MLFCVDRCHQNAHGGCPRWAGVSAVCSARGFFVGPHLSVCAVKTSHSAAHDATLGQLGRSPQGQPGGKSLGWEGQGTAFGGALAHQPVSSPWPWPMNGPEARGSPGAQQYGAVAPTTTSTQAASSLGGLLSGTSGELLPNHLPQQQATHRGGSSPSTGLHRRCCG